MGADGHFQGLPGLVELLLLGVDHGEVVVGFRQFRIILGQPGEYRDGFRRFVHLGQDDALEEASLGILGLVGQILVDLHQRLGILPLLDLLADVLQRVGMNRRCQQERGRSRHDEKACKVEAELGHGMCFSLTVARMNLVVAAATDAASAGAAPRRNCIQVPAAAFNAGEAGVRLR